MKPTLQPSQPTRPWPFKVGEQLPPQCASPSLLRTLLSNLGPLAEQDLAQAAGLDNPNLVRALLKLDLCLGVASRTIIWSLVKQMRVRLIPLFHGLHGRTALER